MAKLIYLEADEEITAVIDRIRDLPGESTPVLVLPAQGRALQSALNVRLLRQYSQNLGKRTAIISGDPRTQALTVEHGFATFPTIDAWERGVEVSHASRVSSPAGAAGRGAATTIVPAGRGVAAAVAEPPPRVPVQPVPRKLERYPPAFVPPAKPRGRLPWVLAGAAAGLALLAVVAYLPSATITLAVAGTPLATELKITGSKDAVPAGATAQVQTTPVELKEFKGAQVASTGTKTIPATTAGGRVVLTNKDDLFGIRVPTGFCVTTGQIEFRTTETVVLDAGKSASAGVTADKSGAAGNVETGKINTACRPADRDRVGVTNRDPTSGGADAKNLTVVSADDQKKAEAALLAELEPKVKQLLTAKASGTLKVAGEPAVTHDTSFDRSVGDEAANFNASVTVVGKEVLIDEAVVKRLLNQALKAKLPPRHELTDDPVKTTFAPESVTPEGNVILAGRAQGTSSPIFSLSQVRALVRGKSPADARQAASHLESVREVQVRQEPFGLPRLPFFGSRIFVKVHQLRAGTGVV